MKKEEKVKVSQGKVREPPASSSSRQKDVARERGADGPTTLTTRRDAGIAARRSTTHQRVTDPENPTKREVRKRAENPGRGKT